MYQWEILTCKKSKHPLTQESSCYLKSLTSSMRWFKRNYPQLTWLDMDSTSACQRAWWPSNRVVSANSMTQANIINSRLKSFSFSLLAIYTQISLMEVTLSSLFQPFSKFDVLPMCRRLKTTPISLAVVKVATPPSSSMWQYATFILFKSHIHSGI